jgi:hypothetical protein
VDLVHGPLTGGHSESDPVHARPVAVAVRTACLLLPVRESKSINNVGTSFAINRINERTIDVLARKRQTITNTITRPSARAGPRWEPARLRAARPGGGAGAGHVRFGRTVISVAFTPARITHSITVPIDHTNAHMPRPRVDVSLDRPSKTAKDCHGRCMALQCCTKPQRLENKQPGAAHSAPAAAETITSRPLPRPVRLMVAGRVP